MNILLTGASGLLGAHIARVLIERSHTLVVLMRPGSDTRGIDGLPCTRVYGDLTQPHTIGKALEGCDAVIHGAALTDQWPTGLSSCEAVNVDGTLALVDAAVRMRISRFVFISTANTLGNGTRKKPGTELDAFSMFRFDSGYINSKFLAEQYVLEQVARHGLSAVVVNPTFMLGPFDLKPSSGQLLLHARKTPVQIIPPGGKNFIHVRDAAIGVCNALTEGIPGERYLLAGENLSYREFFSLVNQMSGRKPLQIPLPGFLLQLIGRLGTWKGRLFGGAPRFNAVTARLACTNAYYSNRKAVEELGLPQTPVSQAVKEALEWFVLE